MKKYLTIVEIETNEVVKKVDVTGYSERMTERVETGMLMNLNRDKFYVGELEED